MKYTSTHKSMTPRAVLLKSGTKPIAINKPFFTARPTLKSAQQKMTSFVKTAHSNVKRPFKRKSTAKNKVWPPTVRPKIPIVGSKVSAAKPTVTADKRNKGKAIKASARWIWKPKQNSSGQVDESMLWHKRLGHLNFKTMNKLVRSNLVKGLPSKSFKNDHSYVACLKGKQHKESCKFDAKADEGYFVGYSLSSKVFRVFNKRTKKIEENLHVDFLENKSIEKGTSPDWLFDIDTLTNSINYVPVVVAGTSSTNISGIKEDVHQAKDDAIPDNNAPHKEQEEVNRDKEVLESSGNSNPTASIKVSTNDSFELASSSTVETEVPTISTLVPTDTLYVPLVTSSVSKIISRGGSSFPEPLSLGNAMSFENRLEDFFRVTSEAVSLNDVEADLSNMEIDIQVLVDCPSRVRPIGMKWVLKNKKDERGIVIRNKTRLVAQGHTQEEGIDYEEGFAPVARIEAIRLFLAYASYIGFIVYQMDVKSAFLYETIDEEVYVMQPLGFQDPEFPHRVYKVEKAMYGLYQAPRAWYGTLSKYLLDNGFQIGKLNFFLGIQVLQKKDGIFLSQDIYVGDILRKFRYTVIRQQRLLWVERILGERMYLKGNPKLGLWYPKESPFDLVAYSDSDYGGANQDRKSITRDC
nr:hypothetical protein [Tanacetum cinerariifolium]